MGSLSKSRLLRLSAALAAGLALQPAIAQTVSNTGTGSAVVVPYYTVNDGWRSLLTITNTTGNSLNVKVRFHESRNSRDVLDFNIGLSPRDVWTGFLAEESVNGLPTMVLRTQDVSCVSPLALHPTLGNGNLPASIVGYSDFGTGQDQTFRDHDATNGSRQRAFEGYVVILVMGETIGAGDNTAANAVQNDSTATTPINTLPVTISNGRVTRGTSAAKAKHINGVPRDCIGWDEDNRATASGLNPLFVNQVRGTTAINLPGDRGSGSPCARLGTVDASCTSVGGSNTGYGPVTAASANALKVQASLRKGDSGYAAATEPLHIAGWGVSADPANPSTGLVTAQQFPYFFEPTLASTQGLWTTTGLPALEGLISSAAVVNDWVNNPNPDPTLPSALSEWVLTFPTKHFHADEDYDNIQAACSRYRNTQVTPATGGRDTGVQNDNLTAPGAFFTGFSTTVHPTRPREVVLSPGGTAVTDVTTCALAPFSETFQAAGNGQSFIEYSLTVYDREERSAAVQTGGTTQSPNPPAVTSPASLFYEANTLRIARNPANVAGVLSSPLIALGDASALAGNQNFGWARVGFTSAPLPVTGFMMRVRQFAGGSPNQNDADAVPHARIVP
jgi:hypothetical protein